MKRYYNVDQNIVYTGKYCVLAKLDEFHNIVTILWNKYSSIPFDVFISQLTRRMMNISLDVRSIFFFCIHCRSLNSIALYGSARFQLMFWLQSHKWESFVLACSTNNSPLMLTIDSSCFTLINADADWGFCFEKARRCVGLVGCGRNSSLSELC